MTATRILATTVVLTVALPAGSAAQRNNRELDRALGALQYAANALPPTAKRAQVIAAITWLQRHSKDTDPAQVSAEYVRSLRRAADLLWQQRTNAVVDDVLGELETKVDHCRTLGIGMGGSVLLRINTRRGSQPVGDWQVFYLLKIYERIGTTPAPFPQLSTPTEARIDPGRYWVWARDPASGRTGERLLVRVAGQTELSVDLPIP